MSKSRSWTALPLAALSAFTFTLTLALSACGPEPVPTAADGVAQPAPARADPPTYAAGDTSVPDASGSFAAQDASERAKVSQEAAAALNVAGPPNTMSREQESKAMPLAGQANDHSTAVRNDKYKGKPVN